MGSSHGNSQGDYLAISSTVWHRGQRQSGSSDVYRRHLGQREREVGIAATLYELSSRITPPTQHTDEHKKHFCLTELVSVTFFLNWDSYSVSQVNKFIIGCYLSVVLNLYDWNSHQQNIQRPFQYKLFLLHSDGIMAIYYGSLRTTDLN